MLSPLSKAHAPCRVVGSELTAERAAAYMQYSLTVY